MVRDRFCAVVLDGSVRKDSVRKPAALIEVGAVCGVDEEEKLSVRCEEGATALAMDRARCLASSSAFLAACSLRHASSRAFFASFACSSGEMEIPVDGTIGVEDGSEGGGPGAIPGGATIGLDGSCVFKLDRVGSDT